jgi:hypothetical protein
MHLLAAKRRKAQKQNKGRGWEQREVEVAIQKELFYCFQLHP